MANKTRRRSKRVEPIEITMRLSPEEAVMFRDWVASLAEVEAVAINPAYAYFATVVDEAFLARLEGRAPRTLISTTQRLAIDDKRLNQLAFAGSEDLEKIGFADRTASSPADHLKDPKFSGPPAGDPSLDKIATVTQTPPVKGTN